MLVHGSAGMQQISSPVQETLCQCSVSWKIVTLPNYLTGGQGKRCVLLSESFGHKT